MLQFSDKIYSHKTNFYVTYYQFYTKQDRQHTYNVTLRSAHVTAVAVEKQ